MFPKEATAQPKPLHLLNPFRVYRTTKAGFVLN